MADGQPFLHALVSCLTPLYGGLTMQVVEFLYHFQEIVRVHFSSIFEKSFGFRPMLRSQ